MRFRTEFVNWKTQVCQKQEHEFEVGCKASVDFGRFTVTCKSDGSLEISAGLDEIAIYPSGCGSITVKSVR